MSPYLRRRLRSLDEAYPLALWRVEFLNRDLDWDWVEVEARCESEARERGAEIGCVPAYRRPSLRARRLHTIENKEAA